MKYIVDLSKELESLLKRYSDQTNEVIEGITVNPVWDRKDRLLEYLVHIEYQNES